MNSLITNKIFNLIIENSFNVLRISINVYKILKISMFDPLNHFK